MTMPRILQVLGIFRSTRSTKAYSRDGLDLDHLRHRLAHDRVEPLPDLPLLVPQNLTRERVDGNDFTEVAGLANTTASCREVVTSSSRPGFGHNLSFLSRTWVSHLFSPYITRRIGEKKSLAQHRTRQYSNLKLEKNQETGVDKLCFFIITLFASSYLKTDLLTNGNHLIGTL